MGYENIATPKQRRQLVRKPLSLKIDNTSAEKVSFTATKLVLDENANECYNESVLEQEQCISVCCQLHPEMCRYVPKKVKTAEVSTQTEDFIKLDHPYAYDKTVKNASTQHTT